MLIRSNNTLKEEADDFTRSKLFNEPFEHVPANSAALPPSGSIGKPPQNRYEALFIKLFAKITLQLILSFAAIFLSIVIVRDLIGSLLVALILALIHYFTPYPSSFLGLRIDFLKLSFWFKFLLNLSLFITLIFAKMKCISSN